MIFIIFAPPRTGKTCFMTHCLNQYAFDLDRNKQMRREIRVKNENGFNLTIPTHCVSANYDITFRKFGYSARHNRRVNPFRLGFANEYVKKLNNAEATKAIEHISFEQWESAFKTYKNIQ